MTSTKSIRFRLLADLPLEVAFKSFTYRLAIVQVSVSGMWQLRAGGSGGYWLCAYRSSEEALRKAVCTEEHGKRWLQLIPAEHRSRKINGTACV